MRPTCLRAALVACILLCSLTLRANTVPQEFTLTEPDAKAVFLLGEFNGWKNTATPMQRDEHGRWSVTVSLPPGRSAYKFLVDGQRRHDHHNPDKAPDGRGAHDSFVTVRHPGDDPVTAEKSALSDDAKRAFARGDFAQLEAMADELRRTKARFSDGLWKLPRFYHGLQRPKQEWSAWLEKLDAWQQQFPDSPTGPLVRATGWIDYGWEARGSGFADTVTKEGSRLFQERLQKAREILDAAGEKEERCPHWTVAMQSVALGQSWPRDDYRRLFKAAAEKEPTYYDYYRQAAFHLFPRWHGRPGEWEKAAEEWSQRYDPEHGLTIYTRAAWYMADQVSVLFRDTAIAWPKMRQGFLDIEKQFPGSRWNLSGFCRFAVMARDRPTAHKLMQRIGSHGDELWNEIGRYEAARVWADPKTPPHFIKPKRVLDLGVRRDLSIPAVAFAPDGQTLLSGHYNSQLVLWDVQTGEQIWSESPSTDPVVSVAFSPDGKFFAAAASERTAGTTKPGLVQIWHRTDQRQLTALENLQSPVCSITFTPDSKTLIITGGKPEAGEVHLYHLENEQLQPVAWAATHQHSISAAAVSPDGRHLAIECDRAISVWDMHDDKMLLHESDPAARLHQYNNTVAFSPDGKFLAVAGAPHWSDRRSKPGHLVLFDTATWKQHPLSLEEKCGGILSVAFSPDSRLVATAGSDTAVRLWDVATGKRRALYFGHDSMVWGISFASDGKSLASGGHDGIINLWEVR